MSTNHRPNRPLFFSDGKGLPDAALSGSTHGASSGVSRRSGRKHVVASALSLWLGWSVAIGALQGCTRSTDPEQQDGNGGNGGNAGSAGKGSGGGNGEMTPNACRTPNAQLPPARLGRLTQRQYARTLAVSFGIQIDASRVPADAPSGDGFAVFDSMLADKQVSEQHFTAYAEVAGEAAKSLLPKLEADFPCIASAPDAACGESVVLAWGARAFRRPLNDEEKRRWTAFYTDARGRWDGRVAARMVLEALLQSPNHVYRSELGEGADGRVALTGFEVANELSYMLTDGPPDAELQAAARDGKLASRSEVLRQARRLVGDEALHLKVTEFFGQMLGVTPMLAGNLGKDQTAFPEFSPALRDAMLAETAAFIDKVFAEDGSVRTLYGAKHSYLDKTMAQHYGVADPGASRAKISLPSGRRGLLGQASVLSAASHADATSPSMRGMLIFTKLLCRQRPVAPPGAFDSPVGKVISPEPRLTQREHWAYAQKTAPQCTACHATFVPMGLGLEQFDSIGRHRTMEYGKPLDTTVTLSGYGEGADGSYPDTLALGEAIIASPFGQRCMATQLRSYALGVAPPDDDNEDACEIGELATRFAKSGLRIVDLLVELTATDSFYERQAQP